MPYDSTIGAAMSDREVAEKIVPDWQVVFDAVGFDVMDIVMDFQTGRKSAGQTMDRISDFAIAAATTAKQEQDDAEIVRIQDGIRDYLVSLGVPDGKIDGAGCDSGDPLDFTKAEIAQGISHLEDVARQELARKMIEAAANEHLEDYYGSADSSPRTRGDVAHDTAVVNVVKALKAVAKQEGIEIE